MYIHIAIFKWKSGVARDAIDDALLLIESLARKVPGILDISVGDNTSKYSEGYSHVVLVRGESQEAINAYRHHPDHERAAAILDAAEEHGIGVDFVAGQFAADRGRG